MTPFDRINKVLDSYDTHHWDKEVRKRFVDRILDEVYKIYNEGEILFTDPNPFKGLETVADLVPEMGNKGFSFLKKRK